MVKSLKNPDFSFKISFLFKILVIVVRRNRLLSPILVRKKWLLSPKLVRKKRLLSPILVRRKWLPVQYEQEKMVTHYNLDSWEKIYIFK